METTQYVLRFPGTLSGLEEASCALRGILDARRLATESRYNIELVFEEIAANIVRHGRPAGDVRVGLAFDKELVLTFEDDGVAFDPREQPAPPVPASIDEARVGGLGLVLTRKICARMDYVRTPDGRNRLTLAIAVP